MILIVYPLRGDGMEAIPEEVQDLANTIPNSQMVGVHDSERPIFAAIDKITKSNEGVRGLWIAGHAETEHVKLGDVELSGSALVTYVRSLNANWVVFNTCHGDHLARRLRVETGVATLGVNTEDANIEDRDAWRMAAAMARVLVQSDMDLGAAYRHLDPRGGGQYLFRPALEDVVSEMVGTVQRDVPSEIHQIKLRLALLEQQVDLKLSSIAMDVAELKLDTGDLKKSIQGSSAVSWNALLVVMGITLVYFTILAGFIGYVGGP